MSAANTMSTVSAANPVIAVTKGHPTAAELAAVLAVLTARAGQVSEPGSVAGGAAPAPAWAERSRGWFTLPRPGPRAWRASALPR